MSYEGAEDTGEPADSEAQRLRTLRVASQREVAGQAITRLGCSGVGAPIVSGGAGRTVHTERGKRKSAERVELGRQVQ